MARPKTLPDSILKNADAMIALGVAVVVIMMVIPIPAWVLDIGMALSITISMIVLLSVMYTVKAIDFSAFPSLLLLTTVYRLSLNVSSTRLILSQGTAFQGKIIRFFGEVVVSGNYVIGIVVFLILVAIQFMVIVKGATRVSEVAARFTLDAMPGKQMAIDADLNSGIITEKEAIERREEIRREADFYGAMDGASKFVQGDVIAGLVITAINIIGGLSIGVLMKGEPVVEAASTYTLLTIGDGLVSQIPSLLISMSTGLIVTRAASEDNLGVDVISQLTMQPRALMIASGMLGFLGALYLGWPMLLFSALTGTLAWTCQRTVKELQKEEEVREKKDQAKQRKPENVASLLAVDPLEVEIGYALIPLVDPEQGGDLLERITMIRRQMALELGLIVPPIRIRDNMQFRPNQYAIKIKGVEVASASIKTDQYLAMNPGTATAELKGEATREPAFGLPAVWIRERDRQKAELAGYTVVDPPSVIATHLTEILKRHAFEILGRQETQQILDEIKKHYPALVEDATKALSVGEIHKILQNLLREGVPIRDMVTILETIADRTAAYGKDLDRLTEVVRAALARHITKQYLSDDGTLAVITLDPRLEEEVVAGVEITPEGRTINMDPARIQRILEKLGVEAEKAVQAGISPLVLTSPRARAAFKTLTQRAAPNLVVLSFSEIIPDIEIRTIGTVAA
ncbi:MAG: flagellar biosynthesis protein FlhA [Candidatus Hydrogenedentota bacterium]|nr:MAG: flagellar biosynthesis protein FlhA [Candidatus Hydrogenedentota bacterium]